MSRSVKQDYPPKGSILIKPLPFDIPTLQKYGAITMISDEQLFILMATTDKRYERKADRIRVEPTQETWARYFAAKAAFRVLEAYEFTEWGGPDTGTEVPEPQSTIEYSYLETYTEWLARCRALRQETA